MIGFFSGVLGAVIVVRFETGFWRFLTQFPRFSDVLRQAAYEVSCVRRGGRGPVALWRFYRHPDRVYFR